MKLTYFRAISLALARKIHIETAALQHRNWNKLSYEKGEVECVVL